MFTSATRSYFNQDKSSLQAVNKSTVYLKLYIKSHIQFYKAYTTITGITNYLQPLISLKVEYRKWEKGIKMLGLNFSGSSVS